MRFTKNKKAYHDYTVLDTFEAGMKLTGAQVKGIRANNIQLKGSYVQLKDNVLKLTGVHISKPSNITELDNFNEKEDILLLMRKKEIKKLSKELQVQGLTLMGLEVYQPKTSNKIKLKLAICRGNKDYDKRRILKEKEDKRTTNDY